ncbi:MAG: M23 family metallopeptidase [Chromatiales bacterium]
MIAFAFLTGPWAFTSYYLRYVLLGLFLLVAGLSFWRNRQNGAYVLVRNTKGIVASLLVIPVFLLLNVLAVMSFFPAAEAVNVNFPFRPGTYYVLQGGGNAVANPFHSLAGEKLAVDIVSLNSFGNRADGVAPQALSDYEIFGEKLYSPCQARVIKTRDGLPDNQPGNPDIDHPEGNYLTLSCAGADILLAHLKQNSIRVTPGQYVQTGQWLAEIGNSGNSLEPHLHIGATKNGTEIGLRFDGRWLTVNSVISRE